MPPVRGMRGVPDPWDERRADEATQTLAKPLILPCFRFVGHEVHHVRRYAWYPGLLGVGLMMNPSATQERIFRTLIARNAINMHAPQACVIDPGDPNREAILIQALRQVIV